MRAPCMIRRKGLSFSISMVEGVPADAPRIMMSVQTIPHAFQESLAKHGDLPALMHPVNSRYASLTYRELGARVERCALGLLRLGVQPGDRLGVISENRPEWAVVDLAMQSVGAINTPVFTTLPPAQLHYLFQDSGVRFVFVSDAKQLRKMLAIRDRLPALEKIILFSADGGLPAEGVLPFRDLTAPEERDDALRMELAERQTAVKPDDLASLIYTSGTTGEPKGAMLTHRNFVSNAFAALEIIDVGPGDRYLSFLPLNHVFERLVGHYLMLFSGTTVAYAENLFTLPYNMVQVRPTIMAGVPRFYETTADRILQQAQRGPRLRRRLIGWALRVAREWAHLVAARSRPPVGLTLAHGVADLLVYKRVRKSFGGALRMFVSGGAPLPPEVNYLFHGLGITLMEGYGLTETSPVISVNPGYETLKVGTVGPPVPGVEVKIAEDGEILTRGPHVMKGYWNKPEETAAVLDEEGWLHTGDIGRLDEDGYLIITDRRKNILVLANGKNVAPAALENKLKSSPLIGEVMLIGDRQKFVTALVVPDFEALSHLAREEGWEADTPAELVAAPEANRAIAAEIKRLSHDFADFEKVRKFRLLEQPFTVENGELTPTLKLKRSVILERYAEAVHSMVE